MASGRVVVSLVLAGVVSLTSLLGCGQNDISTPAPTATATSTGGLPAVTATSSPQALPTATAGPQEDGNRCRIGTQCVSGHCVDDICCNVAACPTGERCDIPNAAGQCATPAAVGSFCSLSDQCTSGFCVDNVCCTSAACGAGASCNVFGHEGECTTLPTHTATPLPTRTVSATGTIAFAATPSATVISTPTPALRVSSVAGKAGEQVTIVITLQSSGIMVAGTQNDLRFDGVNIAIATRPNGSPDCTVEPTIGKDATAFAFLPNGCAGSACTSVRALVLSVDNLDPIAEGSVLYRCTVVIAAEAADGVYPVTIDNIVLSDPQGNAIGGAGGVDGNIFVGATPTPTSTWTPEPAATPRPTAALRVGSAAGHAGEQVSIAVTFSTNGALVAGAQNDLRFDGVDIAVAARTDGTPACAVEPTINKGATAFAFLPNGCAGSACTSVRALVVAFDNLTPIADGSVLYRCTVDIAPHAADGAYPVTVANVALSDPYGRSIPVLGIDGLVQVGAGSATIALSGGEPAHSGTQAVISATLHSNGVPVAGTQNDITFRPQTVVATNAHGKPDCTVNPVINKEAASFAFRCSEPPCATIRALVLSTDNVDTIPDGSLLYTCVVNVAADALGSYPLTISGVIMADPNGARVLGASGVDGTIVVQSGLTPIPDHTPTAAATRLPTHTPTATRPSPSPTRTATATAAPTREVLQANVVAAGPGQQVHFSVTLHSLGFNIAGLQNDIAFDSTHTPIATKANGRPDCTVNPAINKGATSFAFRPNGCSGTDCTMVRVLMLATDNVDPIADGSLLYTCTVNVAANASGRYPLTFTNVIASTPEGASVPGANGTDGAIVVGN